MTAVAGYTTREPHGYLTGDYPHGGVVTGDRAHRENLCRGPSGFRLWRTPPDDGKPDGGVCVVLSCKGVTRPRVTVGQRSKPEPAGLTAGGTKTRKAP